jgi:phosphatidylglycerol lysyltransferase
MGRYARGYVAGQRVYLAKLQGALVGFITLHQQSHEWTLDIMRHSAALPDGGMHRLVFAAIEDARVQGIARLSLAAVPAAAFERAGTVFDKVGMGARVLAAARALGLTRALGVAGICQRDAGLGLRRFKDSFAPRWQARYLCARHVPALALSALAIARAVARPAAPQGSFTPLNSAQSGAALHIRFAPAARIWHGKRQDITS